MRIEPAVDIPIVDFSDPLAAAPAIARAFRDVGFLYLVNHGIDEGLLASVFAQGKRFFARPPGEKKRVAWTSPESNCGYIGPKVQHLDPKAPGDLMEAYNIGLLQPGAADFWPADMPDFRETLLAFYAAGSTVCGRLMSAIATSFELPADFFDSRHDADYSTVRVLHYPPAPLAAGAVRAGAHSDYGTVTLLFQDDVGGLEILQGGRWLAAPPIPGTCIVNTGDLMERWTNDVFRSTKHRVVVPSEGATVRHRYSATFFYRPNVDAEIVCLQPCVGPGRPAAYEPTTTKRHLIESLRASYKVDAPGT